MYAEMKIMSQDSFRVLLEDQFLPVQAFFNAIPDSIFIKTLEGFAEGHGCGADPTDCCFPGDLDPHEKTPNGIRFSLFDEQVDISKADFVSILEVVCQSYLEDFPADRAQVENQLTLIREILASH